MIDRGAYCRSLRFFIAVAGCLVWGLVGESPLWAGQPKVSQELFFSLKEAPAKGTGVALSGPDAKEIAKFEPAGLRIELPVGHPGVRPALGISSNAVVQGNFEITVSFEVLHDPEPADTADFGTRLALIVGMESANQSTVKFSRSVRAKNGIEFLAFTAQWNAVDNKHDKRYLPLVTKIKSGRLRLVREDGMLSFQAADGDQGKFEQLRSYPFTKDDLQTVRVVANTDSPKAAFDVRVSDLRIRMGTPVEQAAAPPVQPDAPGALPANEVQTGNRGWLVAFILIGLTTALLIATAIGLAFYVRMRAAGQAPPKNTPLKN